MVGMSSIMRVRNIHLSWRMMLQMLIGEEVGVYQQLMNVRN